LLPVAVLLAGFGLAASACGSSTAEAETGVASLAAADQSVDGGQDQPGDTGDRPVGAADADGVEAPDDPDEAFRLYERCLSDAGFDLGGSIGTTSGAGGGVAVDGQSDDDLQAAFDDIDWEAYEEAETTCSAHLVNALSDADRSPEQKAALEDAELAYNNCMTDAGFPVEEGNGDLIIESDSDDWDLEAYEEANQACVASAFENNDELNSLFEQEGEG
jgi:hypothetical protein